ncbi:MAG: hypothetical protein OES69_15770 [Myxococcales bacterium]|nr:hypothetical protein [Myxococcales bacterium]MDH3845403.1 hypothetical protein [Myxococcales bacterium]
MEEPNNAEDAEHLSALSIGHYIMAGLSALSAIPLVAYAFAGAKLAEQLSNEMALTMGDISGQAGVDPLAGAPMEMMEDLGTLMITMTALGFLLAVVTAIGFFLVGLKLRQRQWWTFCYLSGWGECLLFPFGTILGVFTIIVLSRPTVKRSFGMR